MTGGMPARMRVALVVGCLLAVLVTAARADGAVTLQPVGTFNDPINIASPPGDPRLFVVERSGTIEVVHDGTTSQFLDISSMVRVTGEQGLLSMAFDPNYASNGLFYVFFTDNGTGGAGVGDNHVDEFKVSSNPNVANLASRRPVLTIDRPDSGTTNHNGGQLQFGKDGLLYISVGDDANGANAQTTANPHGKILRIDPHAASGHAIPATNPFTGSATPEIWSLGLRNPFRFSFDHLTGDLVIADVGQSAWEEVDLLPSIERARPRRQSRLAELRGLRRHLPGGDAARLRLSAQRPGRRCGLRLRDHRRVRLSRQPGPRARRPLPLHGQLPWPASLGPAGYPVRFGRSRRERTRRPGWAAVVRRGRELQPLRDRRQLWTRSWDRHRAPPRAVR